MTPTNSRADMPETTETPHKSPSTHIDGRSAVAPKIEPDHAWENQEIILQSLLPRSTPARPAHPSTDTPAATGSRRSSAGRRLLARAVTAPARATRRRLQHHFPPERRARSAAIAAAVLAAVVLLLLGMQHLVRDAPTATAPSAPPISSAATHSPAGPHNVVLRPAEVKDLCPKDAPGYSPPENMFDGKISTAWVCPRAGDNNGQLIKISFERLVSISQIRVVGGYPFRRPDGVNEWSLHRIVTSMEFRFPRESAHAPVTVNTEGKPDFASTAVSPPATTSRVLGIVKETSDPPPATNTTTPTTTDAPARSDDGQPHTTVAISEIEIIGIQCETPGKTPPAC
jgi:hypothetical protein